MRQGSAQKGAAKATPGKAGAALCYHDVQPWTPFEAPRLLFFIWACRRSYHCIDHCLCPTNACSINCSSCSASHDQVSGAFESLLTMHTGKDNTPVAFAGFAALLAPVAPPPFVGLGADRRPTASAAAMCASVNSAAMQNFTGEKSYW